MEVDQLAPSTNTLNIHDKVLNIRNIECTSHITHTKAFDGKCKNRGGIIMMKILPNVLLKHT